MKKLPIILIALMIYSVPVLAVIDYDTARKEMLTRLREGRIAEAETLARKLIAGPPSRKRELGNEYLTIINIINSVKQASQAPVPAPTPQVVKGELTQTEWIKIGNQKGWMELLGAGAFPTKKPEAEIAFKNLLVKVDQAQINPDKVKIVKDGLNLVWSKGDKQQIILDIQPSVLKALEIAGKKDTVRDMLNVYINMPQEEREALKNMEPEKISAILLVTKKARPEGPPPALPPRPEAAPAKTAEIGVQTTAPQTPMRPTTPPPPPPMPAPKVSAELTTAEEAVAPTQPTAPTGLLVEITKGKKLKHVEQKKSTTTPKSELEQTTGVPEALKRAIEQRRGTIEPEETSAKTPEEEEAWE